MKTNLKVKIGNLQLKNPVMVASGTFGYAEENDYENFFNADGRRLPAQLKAGGHADNRRFYLRKSALDLR